MKRKSGEKESLGRAGDLVAGLILGAGLMFLLDPDRGKRRRALVRDQIVHGMHKVEDLGEDLVATTRHLQNRARGVVAETRSRLRREDIEDSVLEARVRTAMGRVVSNPGAIDVFADSGRITLSGPVLAAEVGQLLATVSSVSGVAEVNDQLHVYEQPGDIPGLQGTQES